MSKPNFVYVTYIASTPDKVFKALTDTEATARFWFGNAVSSDWKVGSPVTFRRNGELVVSGKVLEFDPPRRLSYTFHSQHDGLFTEQPSRVVLEIEQQKDQVKLTMTQTTSRSIAKCLIKSATVGHSCCRTSRPIWRQTAPPCMRPGMTRSRPLHHDRLTLNLWGF